MKIAVLRVEEPSSWPSCRTISKNLHEAYELVGRMSQGGVEFHSYSSSAGALRPQLEAALRLMKERKVQRLVILDHYPRPVDLFAAFGELFEDLDYHPEVFVHIYGCLTLWLHRLDPKDPFFKRNKLHFITASVAQRDLLAQFLASKSSVSVSAFPLDASLFKPPADRRALRRRLGFPEKDVLLIYTGRAHIQKNLHLLLENIAPLFQENKSLKFLFAGGYDDGPINASLEYRYAHGTNNALVKEALEKGRIKDRFVELGNVDRKSLARYLAASDVFCSLSTFNDEDFGYAPLEALTSGCAALLSAWGGYKEFESPYVSYVKVRREFLNQQDSLYMSPQEVRSRLGELVARGSSQRKQTAEFYRKRFSIEAVAATLHRLHRTTKAVPVSFNLPALKKYSEKRKYPMDKYYYMDIYEPYYR